MVLRIAFGDDGRIEVAQQADAVAERGVDEDQAVGLGQVPSSSVAADGQLPRIAAERRPFSATA